LTAEAVPAAELGRVLEWDGCLNVRDLGGLRTRHGRSLRRHALVRSDLLCRLTQAAHRAPLDHGVRTIIDLRFADEAASDWDRYPYRAWQTSTEFGGLRYLNVPFHVKPASQHPDVEAAYRAAADRRDLNRLDLDLGQPGAGAAVAAIADAQPGGVLIHCHGGKDRTGIVAAVVLSYLGVSDEAIAGDYALTMINLEPLIAEWLDSMSRDPVERDRLRALATPTTDAMLDTLDYLRRRYGSAEAYLRGGGVSDEQLARLRARLLE
jgi:protein tyrosine/serine phosphatase